MTDYVARPLVGICVLVEKHGKSLLGKRKGSHGAGEYAAPGGHLEYLESFNSCAAREVLEETGLQIGPLHFLRVSAIACAWNRKMPLRLGPPTDDAHREFVQDLALP